MYKVVDLPERPQKPWAIMELLSQPTSLETTGCFVVKFLTILLTDLFLSLLVIFQGNYDKFLKQFF